MNSITLITLIVASASYAESVCAQGAETSGGDDFNHFGLTNYGQIGAGFVVLEERGEGIVTVNLEMSVQLRYYFATDDHMLGGKRPRDVSVFLRTGVGPLLVDEGLVPVFCTINPGFTYDYLDTNVSYGFLWVLNFNARQGPLYLYGVSASLDQVQIPFFVHFLTGDGMEYLLMGGFRVPLSSFIPVNFRKKRR